MKTTHICPSVGKLFLIIASVFFFSSCEKLIENKPSVAQLLDKEVFKDSATVKSSLAGLYTSLINNNRYSVLSSTLPGFSADELNYVGNTYDQFILNAIIPNNPDNNNLWSPPYVIIYNANAIIEGAANGSNMTDQFKNQTIGEARFVRAFCYFYLVNFFGDVPLILTTDVDQNKLAPRTAVATVYQQIVEDLLFAQANLPATYALSPGLRVRASKWAATALLSRTYLYLGDWSAAETQSASIINNTTLFGMESLSRIFVPSSKEAILQFYNDGSGYTGYASAMLPNPSAPAPKYVYTDQLKNAFSAEADDARRAAWTETITYNNIVYTYPTKYKSLAPGANAEYFTVFRLAEQYLIRAEARAQQNNVAGAREDLLVVRQRAGLGNTSASDKASLLLAIEKERQIELSCEMGHRWFDLKRTGRVDAVIGALKSTWKPTAALYPIPADQRARNGNLTPNPGYN